MTARDLIARYVFGNGEVMIQDPYGRLIAGGTADMLIKENQCRCYDFMDDMTLEEVLAKQVVTFFFVCCNNTLYVNVDLDY